MAEHFSFEFLNTESGWIDFEITYYHAKFWHQFSNVVSTPLEELIYWLEKIYNRQYCEFDCDTEGYHFYLNYDGKYLRLYDQTNLLSKEDENEEHKYLHAVIEINRTDLCKTIYKAFRDFVMSPKYKKVEWQEETTFKETLLDAYETLDNALEIASSKTLQEFYDDYIERTCFTKYVTGFELFDELESPTKEYPIQQSYDKASKDERKTIIKKYLDDTVHRDGSKLQEIKSDTLELLLLMK